MVASCIPTPFSACAQNNMRAEHHQFLRVGTNVSARATLFDEDTHNRWSEAVYGDAWATAVVQGTVRKIKHGRLLVRFDDGDERYLDPEDLELTGEDLRRAETGMGDRFHSIDYRSRASRGNTDGFLLTGPQAADDEPGDYDDEDAPLATLVRQTASTPESDSDDPTEDNETEEDSTEDDGSPEDRQRGGGRGRQGGRGRRRLGRGRGRATGSGRGRGRGDQQQPPATGEAEFSDGDSDSTSEEFDSEDEGLVAEDTITLKGGMKWTTDKGRTVDPFLQRGYQRPAIFKLHNFTEKQEVDYFGACFPMDLIQQIAELMTRRGRNELQLGSSWEVTRGEVYTFLGYQLAVLIFHTGGPKQDLWLEAGGQKYKEALFSSPDLGKYGITFSRFSRLMMAFTLPTYGDDQDPFNPIRSFVDSWNQRMQDSLNPGKLLIVDESMALWKGRGMPGLMVVPRKPTPVGRESHTTACGDTSCIIFVEPYEGKDRMAKKPLVKEWGKAPAVAMRCIKPWWGTGRLLIADAGFASLKLCHGLAEHGTFLIGNVKTGHSGFPKRWLLEQVPSRGCRASATTVYKSQSGETWEIIAAADRDKQPMALIGTAGTTAMGEELHRRFTVIRADGTFHVRNASLAQWDVHATYRRHFNAIDKHNSKRQGGMSFEDSWKTHKWWLREFQMLFGMTEVNAYLLWRRFKPDQGECNFDYFRRRLAYQLLHNPLRSLELGDIRHLRALEFSQHMPMMNQVKKKDGKPIKGVCRFCKKRTIWSCSCAPCLEGMDKGQRAGCMYICSFTQNPACFCSHKDGAEPRNKRSVAAVQRWVARRNRLVATTQ